MEESIIITGQENIRRYQYLALITALKLEDKGLRFRGGSVLKRAKMLTGNRTNDRMRQIQLLEQLV